MKDSTLVILVVAGAALLFWAVSSGIIRTTGGGINVGGGVVAPQPTQNYSGYLAASTAPQVSGAINTAISGLSGLFSGWLSGSQVAPKTGQTYSPSSPSLFAQPSGPAPTSGAKLVSSLNPSVGSAYASYSDTLVGPQVSDDISYQATNGSAFDYYGLASDNAFDPDYSLESYA